MKFSRSLIRNFVIGAWGVGAAYGEAYPIGEHHWPTPNPAFLEGAGLERFAQPTVSGNLTSALFGCVRNEGARFHEGIDLRAIARDGRGESTDAVYAFEDGVVRYVNREAAKSSYGRYIVVEHEQWMPGLVTLYAHLRSVPIEIRPGIGVRGGQRIATMGRSAGGYSIPKSRAHLHFEAGLWLGPDFQRWYDRQGFRSANEHGAYNGMNIVGLDVWGLLQSLRSGETRDMVEFLRSEPTAIEVYVREDSVPELLRVNPGLMTNLSIPNRLAGWKIEFAWYGAPLRLTALEEGRGSLGGDLDVRVVGRPLGNGHACSSLVRQGSVTTPSSRLRSLLDRLFQ